MLEILNIYKNVNYSGGLSMVRVFVAALLFGALVLPAHAEEVIIKHGGLTLNANLHLASGKFLADSTFAH